MTGSVPGASSYFAAESDFDDEQARLRLLENGHDPATIRHLSDLGVGAGWRCLEVAAGAGSIASWLARRVGAGGHVVAIDRDTRFLGQLVGSNVEVRCVDVIEDDLGEDAYDLVHCRGLLFHLPSPQDVLRKMVRAMRAGGWVLVEEADLITFGALDATHPFTVGQTLGRMVDFARDRGIWNPSIGRQLPRILVDLGLDEVGNEMHCRAVRGGEAMALFVESSYARLDEMLLGSNVLTEAEITRRRAAFRDRDFWFLNHMLVSAWGRRPSET